MFQVLISADTTGNRSVCVFAGKFGVEFRGDSNTLCTSASNLQIIQFSREPLDASQLIACAHLLPSSGCCEIHCNVEWHGIGRGTRLRSACALLLFLKALRQCRTLQVLSISLNSPLAPPSRLCLPVDKSEIDISDRACKLVQQVCAKL